MAHALRSKPLEATRQHDKQLRELRQACGEALLLAICRESLKR